VSSFRAGRGFRLDFFCDYGSNILLGERVFFDFNCVVLAVCLVKVGDLELARSYQYSRASS
jgi:hypothetical protein